MDEVIKALEDKIPGSKVTFISIELSKLSPKQLQELSIAIRDAERMDISTLN